MKTPIICAFIILAAATAKAESNPKLIAAVIIAESGGEGHSGMCAVREVIENRALKARKTEEEIVLARKQFSCLNGRKPKDLIAAAMQHPKWEAALKLASGPARTNYTFKATHYHALSVKPKWADKNKVTTVIQNHIFYRL